MRASYSRDGSIILNGIHTAFPREAKNGFLFSGESHDFWEMMYCIKGSATVTAGDRILTLGENKCILFRPMEFHSFRVEKETDSLFFIISFSAEGALLPRVGGNVFQLDRALRSDIFGIIELLNFDACRFDEDRLSQGYLKRLEALQGGMTLLINSLENFLIRLSDSSAAKTDTPVSTEAKIYTEALRHIDMHIGEQLTIEELARLCSVSSAYLKKLFRKYNGLGIHEYILKSKITLARQMLSSGDTVSQISERLGFASPNYFSTAFKRETGISPLEYKKGNFFEVY